MKHLDSKKKEKASAIVTHFRFKSEKNTRKRTVEFCNKNLSSWANVINSRKSFKIEFRCILLSFISSSTK